MRHADLLQNHMGELALLRCLPMIIPYATLTKTRVMRGPEAQAKQPEHKANKEH